MIKASFYCKKGLYCGFIVSGHAGGIFGQDIVCAGVSSAVMLTVNTLTDFLACDCSVRINENSAGLKLNSFEKDETGRALIFSLKEHLLLMEEENGGICVITNHI